MNKKDSKKKIKPKNKKTTKKKDNYFKSIIKELSKVKWPSLKNMVKYTIATVIFCLFFSLFFFGLDVLFAFIKGWFN